jgi:hypothetical protein
MSELNIQLCPETGICSIIKSSGEKVDLMPDEVQAVRDAGGDADAVKAALAQVDDGFAGALNGDEIATVSAKPG